MGLHRMDFYAINKLLIIHISSKLKDDLVKTKGLKYDLNSMRF